MEKEKEEMTVIPPLPQVNTFPIVTDPFGSYTGLVHEPDEQPVQDADDTVPSTRSLREILIDKK